jgi:hypothetical protein
MTSTLREKEHFMEIKIYNPELGLDGTIGEFA